MKHIGAIESTRVNFFIISWWKHIISIIIDLEMACGSESLSCRVIVVIVINVWIYILMQSSVWNPLIISAPCLQGFVKIVNGGSMLSGCTGGGMWKGGPDDEACQREACIEGYDAVVVIDNVDDPNPPTCLLTRCKPGEVLGFKACFDGGFAASCKAGYSQAEFVP